MAGGPPSDPARQQLIHQIMAGSQRNRALAYGLLPPADPPEDLTLQQMRVLRLAAGTPGLSVHALARALGVSGPTASGMVERLVRKGLLLRVDDPDDRRVRRVHLTDRAEQILRATDSMLAPMIDLISAELSLAELEQLESTIRMVTDVMTRVQAREPVQPTDPAS